MGKNKWYLGLDMGVASVGWAVTDEDYNLKKVKGKDLWGVREFDEALTAETRRISRISRRRRQREVARIGLLKEYFHDAIAEKDAAFYQRLENSKYYPEDKEKEVRGKNGIFDDEDYQDKEYYKEFPTIFHLRYELLHNPEPHDVRMVYLALLNMFKHRGHFLNAGLSGENGERTLEEVYYEFCVLMEEELGISFSRETSIDELKDILESKDNSRTQKAEKVKELLHISSKEKEKLEYVKAICGLKVSVNKLFPNELQENKMDICFSSYDYEEKQQEIADAIGEKNYEILELMKEMYDIATVGKIMKGHHFLSEVRVEEYEKHGKDLKILKDVLKRFHMDKEYEFLFRKAEKGSYSAYVKSVNSGSKLRRNMKDRKDTDLYKNIRKFMSSLPKDDEQVEYILSELEKESFLPKQISAANGIIPNQIHAREMKKILQNAEEYLPFLKEKDATGLSTSERILQLFTFQIPYYVGPTTEQSKTGWVVRKEEGKVLPWNIEEKIDMKETSEMFISRMVRKCTYLNGEQVLPKASLLYESFCVLNEINSLAIDGERISVALKQDIYNEVLKKGKKVTRKELMKYLAGRGLVQEESQISGVDVTLNNTLSTYAKFKTIFGEKMEEDSVKAMVEKIVFWGTIYGNSKKLLREKIEENYPGALEEQELKRILGFKFKDWGNLSKEFLELPGCDIHIGEKVSLIRMMWETNHTLMELLHSPQLTYGEELEERKKGALKSLCEISAEDLDDYYFSAPVKRMIWQTILIIRELEQVLGSQPERIFIEMTRKPEEKVRTISRKQKFLELYKNIKEEERDWKEEIERADATGTIRSKKMYLYLTQMGRCMYTGERIDLDDLFKDNLYDIDHIYPRHYVKDDNINNNMVLVKKQENSHKSDTYPLEETIYASQKKNWKYLLDKKLITEEKYKRLTGRNSFTDEQKADFIARQLVETSQGTKGVADILKKIIPDTTIVYSKASNVSEFRHKMRFVKCRGANEFHHAQDAYLNIVVGNVYYVKFTENPLNFIKGEYTKNPEKNAYHLDKMFERNVVRGDEIAWKAPVEGGNPGTVLTVKTILKKNTPLMTRRSFTGRGEIWNATLYGKDKAKEENYVPLKSTDGRMEDVTKYGGFTSASTAYFFLVEHRKKEKRVRTLETVPVYLAEKIEHDPDTLYAYCTEKLGLIDPDVRLSKIKMQSLVKKDGYFMYLSGKTGNRITVRNAVNLCLKKDWMQYIKKVGKYTDSGILDEEVTKEKNAELYHVFAEKFSTGIYAKRPNPVGTKLCSREEAFCQLTIEEQCKVLAQILKLSAVGTGTNAADLTLIQESVNTGVMLVPKIITGSEEFYLIHQSVTGLFENRIDLLTV